MSVSITCYQCKILFYVPDYWHTTRVQDHNNFWCPNGHQQRFLEGESAEARERRLRQRAEQELARVEEEKREAIANAEKIARKLKRVEKRANAGVCLDCKRTFANVVRHRLTKHGLKCDSPKLSVVK